MIWSIIKAIERKRVLLRVIPPHSVGAEIGVANGFFSEQILKSCGVKELWLVDPWTNAPDTKATVARRLGFQHVNVYPYDSTSFTTTPTVRELDWAYVDGDHSYKGVLDDLHGLWPMIRSGGVICGDDWRMRPVHDAVKTFCARKGLRRGRGWFTQWVIRK